MGRKAILWFAAGMVAAGWFLGGEPAPEPVPPVEQAPPSTSQVPARPLTASPSAVAPAASAPQPLAQSVATPALARISGSGVALRAGPGSAHAVLDRFEKGRIVSVVARGAEWSEIRDEITRRRGYVATRFLAASGDQSTDDGAARAKTTIAPPKVAFDDSFIVERILSASLAGYAGNCPCPFNVDRAGRKCGKRSAWSRLGGAAPLCYREEVTPDMIAAWRLRN